MRSLNRFVRALPLFIFTGILASPSGLAIPLTPDTFEDGTTMGWSVPGLSPNPPSHVSDGGPGGAGDAYLQVVATGLDGPGGRLSVLNGAQWMGDYLAAGINAITMDVRNSGPDDLFLRLLFENFGALPGPPTDLAVTLADILVPAGSAWMSIAFDLSGANLSALAGTVNGALSDVNVLRLFHNPVPGHAGPPVGPPVVNATLGVDNISAVSAVPEPHTSMLLLGAVAAYLLVRRRRPRVL